MLWLIVLALVAAGCLGAAWWLLRDRLPEPEALDCDHPLIRQRLRKYWKSHVEVFLGDNSKLREIARTERTTNEHNAQVCRVYGRGDIEYVPMDIEMKKDAKQRWQPDGYRPYRGDP